MDHQTINAQAEPEFSKKSHKDNPVALKHKAFETQINPKNPNCLDLELPFLIRCDGHHFSKFTKRFRKPFDEDLQKAMNLTTIGLLKNFPQATFGYTQSDEITLVFPSVRDKNGDCEFIKHGNLQKVASLVSGLCTSQFVFHLRAILEANGRLDDRFNESLAECYFDARVHNVPTLEDLAENVLWRVSDRKNNSRLGMGHAYLSKKEQHGLTPRQVIEKVKEKYKEDKTETIYDWYKMSIVYCYGIAFKKQLYDMQAIDQKTDQEVTVTRTRFVGKAFSDSNLSSKVIDIIVSKYVDEHNDEWRAI